MSDVSLTSAPGLGAKSSAQAHLELSFEARNTVTDEIRDELV